MNKINPILMFCLIVFCVSCNRIDTPTIGDWSSGDRLCASGGKISLCVDLKRGGCFDELHINGGPNIWDNSRDGGRQAQVSLYDGQDYYDPNNNWRGKWGWNPVQCGDRYNHSSRVLSSSQNGNRIEILTKPLQWAGTDYGEAIESDVLIFQTIEIINESSVKMTYKVVHEGIDSHIGANHEFPCMYFKNFMINPVINYGRMIIPISSNSQNFPTHQIIISTSDGKSGIKFTSSGDFYAVMLRSGTIEPGLLVQNLKQFDFVGKGSELNGFIILEFF